MFTRRALHVCKKNTDANAAEIRAAIFLTQAVCKECIIFPPVSLLLLHQNLIRTFCSWHVLFCVCSIILHHFCHHQKCEKAELKAIEVDDAHLKNVAFVCKKLQFFVLQ